MITGRILITGICGFCARHLVKHLEEGGPAVIHGADIHPVSPKGLDLESYSTVDITDELQVQDLLRSIRPDIVFHMAAVNGGNPCKIYRVNFLGSLYLLEAIVKFVPQARVLMVGSASEYGDVPSNNMPVRETYSCNPTGPYGISKYAMTMTALDYKKNQSLKVVVARPFNVVGAGATSLVIGDVLGRLKKSLHSREEIVSVSVGNLDTERDFVAVEDVIEAYIKLIQSEYWGEVFNICSGKPRSVRSVLEILLANSTIPVHLNVDPVLVRSTDIPRSFGSLEKARNSFGFVPKVPLEVALKAAWDEAMESAE